MNKCPNCGLIIEHEQDKYCRKCGTKLYENFKETKMPFCNDGLVLKPSKEEPVINIDDKNTQKKASSVYDSTSIKDANIKHCSSVREIGDTDVVPQSIYKKRKLLRKAAAAYAGLLYIAIVVSSMFLDITHGPLTPRGNRYASMSFSNIDWVVLIFMNVAYILLLLPWFKYAFNKSRDIFSIGIFPATTLFSKIISVLLTLLSMVTGITYTVLHIVYSINRLGGIILDEDRIVILMCYICCIVFWAVVCVVYKFAYWKW